jgi:hypothetical protein
MMWLIGLGIFFLLVGFIVPQMLTTFTYGGVSTEYVYALWGVGGALIVLGVFAKVFKTK